MKLPNKTKRGKAAQRHIICLLKTRLLGKFFDRPMWKSRITNSSVSILNREKKLLVGIQIMNGEEKTSD